MFAGSITGLVIVTRFMVILSYNRWTAFRRRRQGLPPLASVKQGILVSWCGMRGLVTLATAFALPANFPQRDLVVLTAFAVVIGTLVV